MKCDVSSFYGRDEREGAAHLGCGEVKYGVDFWSWDRGWIYGLHLVFMGKENPQENLHLLYAIYCKCLSLFDL